MVRGCYCGDLAQGEELTNFWRNWKSPVIDDFKAMPFANAATISSDPQDPLPGLSTGMWLREINDDVIEALCTHVPGQTPIVFAEIRNAGGAITRVDGAAAAYGNRDAQHSLQMIGVTPTKDAEAAYLDYAGMVKSAMASATTGGVYLNFVDGEEARQQSRRGYSAENYQRLQAVKAKYDSSNRFLYSFDLEAK